MSFPTSPATGKNAKLYISTGDGALETLASMTLQSSYKYKGVTYTDQIYLLGTGKTLINMRPAKEPHAYIDGIIDGLEIAPHASADKVTTTAGTIMVDGVSTSVSADTDISLSRPADGKSCWNAIVVAKSGGAVSAIKGKDVTGEITNLIDTYGDPSSGTDGARPLIGVGDLLIGLVKLHEDEATIVAYSDISYSDRETSDIDLEILPNIGGVKIPTALVKMHTGAIGRVIKFTGYYLDNVLAEISTGKSWSTNPASNSVTEQIFSRNIGITELGAWSFSFGQLATDPKVKNAALEREGYAGIRLQYSNGGYFQGVATLAPTFSSAPGTLNPIEVTGSFLDDPVFV